MHQSAQMSKITNNSLTPSGTGCNIAAPKWQQWAPKDRYVQHSSNTNKNWLKLHYSADRQTHTNDVPDLDAVSLSDRVDQRIKVERRQIRILCLNEHHVWKVIPVTSSTFQR